MTARTPPGGVPVVGESSSIMTRSRRAREEAGNQEAVPRNPLPQISNDHDAGDEQQDIAAGGGETSANHLLTFDDYRGAFYSPQDEPSINRLRNMDIDHGPSSHHSASTMAETLTRLQIDMVRRNGEEMNRSMREEMQLAMREIKEKMRELMQPQQTVPRTENQPHVRLPS